MGLDPNKLPDSLLKCMPKVARKPLGKAGVTQEEADAKNAVKREKELHDQCLAYLRIKGIFCIHSRMDKRSTNQVGLPDLCFSVRSTVARSDGQFFGIPCAVELKLPGCHPTSEQAAVMAQMMDNGWIVRVYTSFESFVFFLKSLGIQ